MKKGFTLIDPRTLRAFTLIELSIVLVIIGLIIGGVLVGKDLIRQAELRKVVSEFNSINQMIYAFRLKYNGLPGDFPQANQLWGAQNGNGNGVVSYNNASDLGEAGQFFYHLSLAGIASGYQASVSSWTIGTSGPASAISGLGYIVISNNGSAMYGTPVQTTYIALGSEQDSAPISPNGPALVPWQAKSVDEKMDDGIASNGRLIGYNDGSSTVPGKCTTSAGADDYGQPRGSVDYLMSATTALCRMAYFIDRK